MKYIEDNNYGELFFDVSFKKMTTIKIGGIVKTLYVPYSIESLIKVFKKILEEKIPYFIIGSGSNLLVNDINFDGVLISLKKINNYEVIMDNVIMIASGAKAMPIIREITKKGYGGLEIFGTIPGTIGGLVYNNAGAYGKTISDVLICIDYLDTDGKIRTISKDHLELKYRSSILKNMNGIILRAYFTINGNSNIDLLNNIFENKKQNQPIEKNNFGSTFKNNGEIKAWQIIRKLNLQTRNFNDAKISDKHANFLINDGNASFMDMCNLINYIKEKAKEQLGYDLILEIEIVNEFKNQ